MPPTDRPHAPARAPEAVAVIGLACRFPGARTPDEYWRVLQGADSMVGPVPATRWRWPEQRHEFPPQAHELRLQRGAFIGDLEHFDADFFGLSQDEAARLDPQQRLVLEATWEALECACLRPRDLAGTFTGVIVGVAHSDHAVKILNDHASYDGKLGLLGYEAIVANRVSHALNLKGPSYAVNSACASSLHALHVACQALRSGECDLVISGGVNVDLTPDESVSCGMAGWTSEDGECRSFGASGDGFVTGEGCGMVVLKRLADALRDGDPVWGVLRDSVLGHNGMSSSISWPSGNAQRDVLRRLLVRNGLQPADVDVLEAHGTGGGMSDRIEASAFTDVLVAGRDAQSPLRVGCCKAHVGHLEAASGVAGLFKTLLSLRHGWLPAIRAFDGPNPAIRPHAGLRFLAEGEAWPRGDRPRRAIVSNFSFGGANGVMLVEEAPAGCGPFDRPGVASAADTTGLRLLGLRARSDAGLAAMVGRLQEHLDDRGRPLDDDEVHTLNVHRADLRQRRVVAGRGLPALDAALRRGAGGALRCSADFPAAWREAGPVLALPDTTLGFRDADDIARLRAGRLGGRLWQHWERAFHGSRAPRTWPAQQALLADEALRRRAMAAFWVHAFVRLGVSLRAVMCAPALAPAAALAQALAQAPEGSDAARRAARVLLAWIQDAGDDGAARADAALPAEAAPAAPHVDAPPVPLARAWSLLPGRASLVFAAAPIASLHRGDAPALGLATAIPRASGSDTPASIHDLDEELAGLLASLFCLGTDLRWHLLSEGARRPVPAPPFDRRRSWFQAAAPRVRTPAQAATPPAAMPLEPGAAALLLAGATPSSAVLAAAAQAQATVAAAATSAAMPADPR